MDSVSGSHQPPFPQESTDRTSQIPTRFPKTITIIGSLNTDLVTVTHRLPAGGETLTAKSFSTGSGGKGANQAVACARVSRPNPNSQLRTDNSTDFPEPDITVKMIGAVGDDEFGPKLIEGLKGDGVNTDGVRIVQGEKTGVAVIIVELGSGENRIMLNPGANHTLKPEHFKTKESLGTPLPDLIILQLEIPLPTVLQILKTAKEAGVEVLLNPAPAVMIPPEAYGLISHLIVNESEAAILAEGEVKDMESVGWGRVMREFIERGVKNVVVTLGSMGAVFMNAEEQLGEYVKAADVRRVADTTAAGDTFVGAYAVSMARKGRKEDVDEPDIKLACKAAARTVEKRGAQSAIPWGNEIEAVFPEPSVKKSLQMLADPLLETKHAERMQREKDIRRGLRITGIGSLQQRISQARLERAQQAQVQGQGQEQGTLQQPQVRHQQVQGGLQQMLNYQAQLAATQRLQAQQVLASQGQTQPRLTPNRQAELIAAQVLQAQRVLATQGQGGSQVTPGFQALVAPIAQNQTFQNINSSGQNLSFNGQGMPNMQQMQFLWQMAQAYPQNQQQTLFQAQLQQPRQAAIVQAGLPRGPQQAQVQHQQQPQMNGQPTNPNKRQRLSQSQALPAQQPRATARGQGGPQQATAVRAGLTLSQRLRIGPIQPHEIAAALPKEGILLEDVMNLFAGRIGDIASQQTAELEFFDLLEANSVFSKSDKRFRPRKTECDQNEQQPQMDGEPMDED